MGSGQAAVEELDGVLGFAFTPDLVSEEIRGGSGEHRQSLVKRTAFGKSMTTCSGPCEEGYLIATNLQEHC